MSKDNIYVFGYRELDVRDARLLNQAFYNILPNVPYASDSSVDGTLRISSAFVFDEEAGVKNLIVDLTDVPSASGPIDITVFGELFIALLEMGPIDTPTRLVNRMAQLCGNQFGYQFEHGWKFYRLLKTVADAVGRVENLVSIDRPPAAYGQGPAAPDRVDQRYVYRIRARTRINPDNLP